MNTPATRDRLFAALNPLVVDGTLTPVQADAVCRAIETDPASDGGAGWDRARLFAALSVLAAGSLATAYSIAAAVNGKSTFGWKSTVLLLGVTAVVATAAVAWFLLLEAQPWSGWVSGALGVLALAGLSLALLILWDPDVVVYLAGVIMLAGGVAGFWFLRGQLFAVVAAVGGLLVLGQLFSDTLGNGGDEGDALTIGIAFLFYGLGVAAVGWFFSCRRLLGLIGLGIGITAMFAVMVVNAAAAALAVTFADPRLGGASGSGPGVDSIRSDIRIALIFGLAVVVVSALVHAYDGYVGFAIMTFVGATVLPVTAVFAVVDDHPLRWGAGFAVVASLGLAAIIGLQLDQRTSTAQLGSAGTPMPPEQAHDPRSDTVAW